MLRWGISGVLKSLGVSVSDAYLQTFSFKMTLPLHHESEVEAPNGKSISIQNAGEHHMGAEHVEFIPSEPISGVKRFFTTNGRLFFNADDGCFYLYDSCMIIRINADSWKVTCAGRPQPLYFGTVSISEGNLNMDLYSGSGGRESHSKLLGEIDWTDGLGSASEGVLPSAYKPWVDEQELLR